MSTQTPIDPAIYWRALADRRKIALQEANRGCNRLKRQVDYWKQRYAALAHECPDAVEELHARQKMARMGQEIAGIELV